jgi:hypothetical protein
LLNSQTGRNKYGPNQHNCRKTAQTTNPKGQSDPGKQKDHAAKEFKDKFGPVGQNKYLVYPHDYDLFNVPAALKKVTRP